MKKEVTVLNQSNKFAVEKPRGNDVSQIHCLINHFADSNEMLPRSLSDLYESLRGGFIVRQDNAVIACSFLHVYWSDLAEIRSLAVIENKQSHGIGSQLVKSCLDEAEQLGITTVFCLNNKPVFFEKLGFNRIDKMELPKIVWADCYRCSKFPNCNAIALFYRLDVRKDYKEQITLL